MNGGQEKALHFSVITINECRGNDRNRQSSFGKYHSKKSFRKHHQKIPKLMSKSTIRNRIFALLKVTAPQTNPKTKQNKVF